jgi:tRNA G10  N-methylase Trm11
MNKQVTYKSDTSSRKEWFTGLSFSHPAKMLLPLQVFLIENFTQPGDVILDPMSGSGTLMVCCSMGRHCVLVELEKKFHEMQNGNWEKVRQRGAQMGYDMGTCTMIQGDARDLSGVLADKIITSPPYAGTTAIQDFAFMAKQAEDYPERLRQGLIKGHARGIKAEKTWLDKTAAGKIESSVNIGNLPYGNIDKIITSPPYEGCVSDGKEGPGVTSKGGAWKDGTATKNSYTEHGIPTKQIDAVISSPPYENAVGQGGGTNHLPQIGTSCLNAHEYSNDSTNIGNLKSTSYLDAMLQVYRQCYQVLKPTGTMVLVTKNYIRNKQIVRLDLDTIKLCETAGFTFTERIGRKLTQQSFWRIIYKQKYPDAPSIDTEDILIFNKGD